MTNFKALQRELLSVVGSGVRKHGFESRPRGQSFRKKCNFGHLAFHLAFIPHRADLNVTADVGVRFDQVEVLVDEGDTLRDESTRSSTCTIGSELGNLSQGRQKRWTIRTADDVPLVGEEILRAFTEIAIPYFSEFSNPGRVLKVLAGDDPDSWRHSPLHDYRARAAVAMALVMEGKESAQRLAKLKTSFLEQRHDPGLPSFRAFLTTLGLG